MGVVPIGAAGAEGDGGRQMKNHDSIIQGIQLTEKGTALSEKFNRYVFKVDDKATKLEIKYAVERIFNITEGKSGRLPPSITTASLPSMIR